MTPLLLLLLGGTLVYVASRGAGNSPERKPDNNSSAGKRNAFVEAAMSELGTLYQWGGGHAPNTWGLDCSGLVIKAAKAAGIALPPKAIPTANGLWEALEHVKTPQIGDLAFYGSGDMAQHVVIMTNWDGTTGGAVSANGDRRVITPEIAKARGAKVTFVPDFRSIRNDFLGFGKIV